MVSTAPRDSGSEARGGDGLIRRRMLCQGTVQGVGFRPAVYRLATALGLGGWVRNDGEGATIEVEGPGEVIVEFQKRLPTSMPPLARLGAIEVRDVPTVSEGGFCVDESKSTGQVRANIPPDTALCDNCRREMEDAGDRRFHYPFITCTDCGPRFSLVRGLPYDRERTSMVEFPMCPACRAEYRDPDTRRFHAEPTCCPDCGPRLWLLSNEGEERAENEEAILRAQRCLQYGGILGVKGVGGFQLACRADDEIAVTRLRDRKKRLAKPLAVMVRDIEVARKLVVLGKADERLLCSSRAPILLAPRRVDAPVAASVAPGVADLGVFLPTTPLHLELFRDAEYESLVMTSGNLSDEPICRTNQQAIDRLGGLVDRLLVHDREVVRRVDDSVVRSTDDGPVVVRRSRGYVPAALPMPVAAHEHVLALGGHLQCTACLAVDDMAVASQHVGDLDTDEARAFLVEVATGLEHFLETEAPVIAVDAHPDYPSAWLGEELARRRGGRVLKIQHHLAHAAAVLAENKAFPRSPSERVGAVILDGTGYGLDGTAWGGEILMLDGQLRWERLAHLEPLPLVGGERAVREPWRVAVAALAKGGALDLVPELPLSRAEVADQLEAIGRLSAGGAWPLASGAGRIFEAAGTLCGLGVTNGYEGEMAIQLEALAMTADTAVLPWSELHLTEDRAELPSVALLCALARRLAAGEAPAQAAAGFHATFARLAAQLAVRVLPHGVTRVALGGGCLVNRLLRRQLTAELHAVGLEALLPHAVPPGDGGLSYGQAVLAAAAVNRGCESRLPGGV